MRNSARRSSKVADEFLLDYKLKHASATFAEYALGHVTDHLGERLVVEITPTVIKTRHTLVAELAESGAGDEVIMSMAGHVSRAMLSRYSHVRMEAKRRALDEIAARQRAAEERRRQEAGRQQCPIPIQSTAVQ